MTANFSYEALRKHVSLPPPPVDGVVTEVAGLLIEGLAHGAAVGDFYQVVGRACEMRAEVVALRGKHAVLLPFGTTAGLEIGARLVPTSGASSLRVGDALMGRVINALGEPLDGKPMPVCRAEASLQRAPLSMQQRASVTKRLGLGVRVLDALVPCGVGQRLGIFAGPGVGKSTLLGMIARGTQAQVIVLALVGERGREVGHFVQHVLGPEGSKRAVVVVATSDRPASERVRAAFAATAIAEYFRDKGRQVLLFVDSLTRFCMAQREIGLAVGEPPTTRGYPPSAFTRLPQLLERVAPVVGGGSITGLYTILVEGDDLTDPVADTTRALLDGHIVLSRALSLRGQFPAVDVLQSLSRLERELLPEVERSAARRVRAALARAEDARDFIAVGAYRPGVDSLLDQALAQAPAIQRFLQQPHDLAVPLQETQRALITLGEAQAP